MSTGRKRVVTGVNAEGKSVISAAGPPPTILCIEGGGMEELWMVDAFPHKLDETLNPADRPEHTGAMDVPGAWFRIVTFAPRSSYPLHTTNTLDFVVVLSGSIRMIMEEGEVTLYPGDSVVQRDTLHAWANDTDDACVVAGILISNDAGEVEPRHMMLDRDILVLGWSAVPDKIYDQIIAEYLEAQAGAAACG